MSHKLILSVLAFLYVFVNRDYDRKEYIQVEKSKTYTSDFSTNSNENPGCTIYEIGWWTFETCNAPYNDYSEFTSSNGSLAGCSNITIDNIYRNNPTTNPHSCSQGITSSPIAMSVSSNGNCSFVDDAPEAVRFDITITPNGSQSGHFGKLEMFIKSSAAYSWLDGQTGINNSPTKFGIRITSNGSEVFKQTEIPLTISNFQYNLVEAYFTNDADFTFTSTTTFNIELLAYCNTNNGGTVSVWEIDNVHAYACCLAGIPCASKAPVLSKK